MLRAIAELNDTPAAVAPAPAQASAPPLTARPLPSPWASAAISRLCSAIWWISTALRRGSTLRSGETWSGLLHAASAAVTEMGGHVAKKLGDGLMSLFGYPAAQENDFERAVRAALAIQRALAELNRKNSGSAKPSLAARIPVELDPWWSMRRARFSATPLTSRRGCRRSPSRARFWSRRGCSVKSRACSSPRSAAAMNSKACRRRSLCSGSCVRAAAAAALGGVIWRGLSVATRKSPC